MVNLKAVERLAELKAQMKVLETEAKDLQKEIIEAGGPDKIKTSFGTLTLASRNTYEAIDSDNYIDVFGQGHFNAAANITVSGVKKAFGDNGLVELSDAGMLTIKSTSSYYTLRK